MATPHGTNEPSEIDKQVRYLLSLKENRFSKIERDLKKVESDILNVGKSVFPRRA